MNITDVLAAFGDDSKATYSTLAQRLNLRQGHVEAIAFASKLDKFNLHTKVARIGSKIVRAYERSHFQQVADTKQPYQAPPALEITL